MNAVLRHELRLALVALQFMTRLPTPGWVGFEPAWLNRCVRHFPLVGMAVGAFGAGVALGAQVLWSPWVAATLAVAATLWLTAAFHEDGLADTFDALLGAAARERALAIMKDSRIGTYGAAVLLLVLMARVALLAELLARDPLAAAWALVASHALGRALPVALMAVLPYAGDAAQAKAKPLARAVRRRDAAWALLSALPLLWTLLPGHAVALLGALLMLGLGLRTWLQRRLGGYTGDTLGAAEQLGEVVVLMAWAAAWRA